MSEKNLTPDIATPVQNETAIAAGDQAAAAPHPSAAAQAHITPSAPTAHPHPSTPRESIGISIDQRAYQQYQDLAQVVLDSADLATQSAEAATSVTHNMRQTTTEFKELTEAAHKKARLLVLIAVGFMTTSLIFFLIMGVRLVSRINQLDTMLVAVGKRVVELNAGMESLENIHKSVQELTSQQSALTKVQSEIEGRIEASLKQSESLVQKVPGETAKQVAASSDSVMRQVQGINSKLQTQANAVQALGNEVKSLRGAVSNVDALKRDMEALVTLQKERNLDTQQKSNSAAAVRDKSLQFPRYTATKPADPAATNNSTTSATAVKP